LADDITRGQGSGGSVSVPLAIGGEVLGALTVAPGRGRLGAGDLALLRAVASVLASAIFRHRAAERARRQAEADRARLAGVLAALPVAVYTVDTAGHVTGANPSATALAGEASAPLLGRPCREVFPLRDEAGRLLCDWACPRERFGQAPVGGVVRAFLPASDAGTRILHWSCAPVRAPDGHQLGWVEVVRDVSQLHEIEAMRQTFLSAVSHELLSPVAIIKGHAETLRDPVTRSDRELAEAALQAIDEESERLRRLVLNVLDAARAASGAFTIERAPLALGPIIERVVRSFRGRSRRHQFATRLPGSLPLVLGDRDRLESVLYNLLDNAVKYSPRGGEVVVRAEVQTTEVEVIVEDEGVGIRRDELERIFQPYVRAIGDGQPNVPGSGLGLSIAKTIIEAHGGRIWMENRPVRGAACHFTVPRAGPAPLPVPRPSQAENAR
jgi:PAS domain S-box-containing protein